MRLSTRRPGPCSCGNPDSHLVAQRRTADNQAVRLHSDGDVTVGWFTVAARRLPREALWLLAGEVEVYDMAEVRALAKAARAAVRQKWFPPLTYLRQRMAGRRIRPASRRWRVVTWSKA